MRKIKFKFNGVYHIYNRGVDKRDIFISNSDYWRFLEELLIFNNKKSSFRTLWEVEKKKGMVDFCSVVNFINKDEDRKPLVKILAYCLMPNHYHLVLKQVTKNGISDFMHKIGTGYTNYFNKRNNRTGSLFQGSFKSNKIVDDRQLKYLITYVNNVNPAQILEPKLKEEGVKDLEKIINFIDKYKWSSHKDYLNERKLSIVDENLLKDMFNSPKKYKEFGKNMILTKGFNKINKVLIE